MILTSLIIMDANARNPENSHNSDKFVVEDSLLPEDKSIAYDATIASDLAEKLVRELAQNGIQCDEQTQMLLRAQITIAYDPQEKYQQLRKDISGQPHTAAREDQQLRKDISGQPHTAAREDQQLQNASLVGLGMVVLALFGLLSQCASLFEPPLDVTTFRNCINSSYPEDFCTRKAREVYQSGRGYP